MQFGLMKLTRIPYADLQREIQEAETMGFDSAWIDDDLFTPSYADFDVWSVLGGLAVATERIRLGTLVTVPTFRLPAVLAAQVLTVDQMSNGRVEVGIGAGGAVESYPAIGVEPWTPRERSERLEEFVAIVSRMLTGKPIDFTGQHYAARVEQVIPPVQLPRPPITVAAHGPRGMRAAATYADGWNTLVNMETPGNTERASKDLNDAVENLKRMTEHFDAICAEVGRDPKTVRRSILLDRAETDPFSSVDAFDEFVGSFEEIGVELIVFYWPPLTNTIPDPTGRPITALGRPADIPLSPEQRRAFERVVAERITDRDRS
jgi:alkanesulfonate monooxygenase SsuD/methylene tetrahydromethanopterin reductase-like flavin-dependent oxidoreductase (luciferase family)